MSLGSESRNEPIVLSSDEEQTTEIKSTSSECKKESILNGSMSGEAANPNKKSRAACTKTNPNNIAWDQWIDYVPKLKKIKTNSKLTQSQMTSYFQSTNPKKKESVPLTPQKQSDSNKDSLSTSKPWWLSNPKASTATKTTSANGNPATSTSYNGKKEKKQCPFYKKIPGTPFTVDAFRYGTIDGCSCYFLSHFHYDHYVGLTKHFTNIIYCSKITANLVEAQLRVPTKHIVVLPMEHRTLVEGVYVTLLDANHCPGSVLFLFELNDGKKILHTGDFRASDELKKYEHILQSGIDTVYLDTTYCNPQYTFPSQQDVIQFAIDCALDAQKKNQRTLIVCGTYTIGKERVFHALGQTLDCKIGVTKAKKKILDCLEWKKLEERITTDLNNAKIHVLTMNSLSFQSLETHLTQFKTKFDVILAFKPTGWTFSQKINELSDIKPSVKGNIIFYGLPYSEHSSFNELEWFIKYVKPKRILPTVNNGDPNKRQSMEKLFEEWKKSY